MNEENLTLLKDWDGIDPTGWMMSEKLDGCRAVWDGKQFWTRAGNVISAPEWFTDGLPADQTLDGELWAGRGGFALASNAARFGTFTDRLSFQIFDRIDGVGKWTDRLASVRHSCAHADVIEHQPCNGGRHLVDSMRAIQSAGGEGLVIRRHIEAKPASVAYGRKRNPCHRGDGARSRRLQRTKTPFPYEKNCVQLPRQTGVRWA